MPSAVAPPMIRGSSYAETTTNALRGAAARTRKRPSNPIVWQRQIEQHEVHRAVRGKHVQRAIDRSRLEDFGAGKSCAYNADQRIAKQWVILDNKKPGHPHSHRRRARPRQSHRIAQPAVLSRITEDSHST